MNWQKEDQVSDLEDCRPVPGPDKEVRDATNDVVLVDDEGDRIACMREYVFLHLATACN